MTKYAERDAFSLEPHYSWHVAAMTTERLDQKSDIAAELAYRDWLLEDSMRKSDVEDVYRRLASLTAECDALKAERDAFMWAKEQNMVAHAAELAFAESARDQAVEKLGEEKAAVVHWVDAFNRASLRVQSTEQALRALRDAGLRRLEWGHSVGCMTGAADPAEAVCSCGHEALEKALEAKDV